MEKKVKITKEMTIREVIGKYPQVLSLFMDYGLHCVGCVFAQGETIETAAKVHQINLDRFLEDLNKAVKE